MSKLEELNDSATATAEKVSNQGSAKPAIPGMTEEGEHLVPQKAAHAEGSNTQSRAERPTSYDVADFAVPAGREEEWRFTPVRRITDLLTDESGDSTAVEFTAKAPEGWMKEALAIGEAPRGEGFIPADRGAVVGFANAATANYLQIPAGQEADEPIFLSSKGIKADTRFNAHTVVEVGENASATLILEHTGSVNYNGNVEYLIRPNASLTVISLQLWEDDAKHVAQHDAVVESGANFRHIAITLGGDVVRMNANVKFKGEGADARLYGLYFADAGQHLEHRSFVNHNDPRNSSDVLYKGALQGKDAHTVWVGDVLISKNAPGTDSYEKNQNLILTDGCRADSIPNLEIETGLIEGAGHASTTARFDETQLFYLMSRGMDETTARRLVIRGFLNEIVQQVRVPEIEERLMEELEKELAISGN